MNRITDIIFGAQLSTVSAATAMFLAHLCENGTFNANWHWGMYPLLIIAIFFMVFPHLLTSSVPTDAEANMAKAMEAHSANWLKSVEANAELANLERGSDYLRDPKCPRHHQ